MTAAGPRELVVAEIFGPTLQGEGPSAGRRCGFLRLGGCNLDCAWCDTPYTWDWSRHSRDDELRRMSPPAILDRVAAMDVDMLVITGGEPMLQQEQLMPVLEAARARGWRIEVETNGTRRPLPELVPLVTQFNVSPKLASAGVTRERPVDADALGALLATGRAVFKFVVTALEDLAEVDTIVGEHELHPVYLMPEGTDAPRILEGMRRLAAPALARGYNLSPRLHILLWGDERGR